MDIPSYITGFTDGEGCFLISFSLRKKMRLGIEVRPSFSVSQHKRSKEIILFLQEFFKCGGVRFSKRDQNYKYEVRSVDDLTQYIIPHFEKYPLQTDKQKEFERFKIICDLIHSNHHLTKKGLTKIITLSKDLNTSGNKKYNREDLLRIMSKMNV
jgi:hypothetical protein